MSHLAALAEHAPGAPDQPARDGCAVVELRQYTLHPGQRDSLIALFDREFVETQEACGMTLIGQFRDLDAPDRFVWLRGFADMATRAQALTAFYGGEVWSAHRAAANATMLDSDDVLLLRPAHSGGGLPLGARTAFGVEAVPARLVVVTIVYLQAVDPACVEAYRQAVVPELLEHGATPLAHYETEPAPNTFPALPVREGETVLVALAAFDDAAHHARWCARADRTGWSEGLPDALRQRLVRVPQTLRLAPTARSRLR